MKVDSVLPTNPAAPSVADTTRLHPSPWMRETQIGRRSRFAARPPGWSDFSLTPTRGDGRHWNLAVDHPDLGRPSIPASVEFARRPLVLAPEILPFVALPVHRGYDMALPSLPVIAEAEACAEKLARYRRTALGRDVYDLAQMACRPIDEPRVRRLWVLKVWGDVVDRSTR